MGGPTPHILIILQKNNLSGKVKIRFLVILQLEGGRGNFGFPACPHTKFWCGGEENSFAKRNVRNRGFLKSERSERPASVTSMTDPITDMLNQVKNAQAVGKTEVTLDLSNLKNEVASILSKAGFIGEVRKVAKGKSKKLRIALKYDNGVPAMEGFKRVSKPGQRIYAKNKEIKKVKGGYGMSIVSTPKGLMTGLEAKKAKLGGEVLLEIW